MENRNKNKKIAIYIAVLIVLLGGSFLIYKVVKASVDNAIISRINIISIETGTNFDTEDNLVITCDNEGKNCTNTYTASKDSSKDNILVKSFDKIKYNFIFDIKDSNDDSHDIDDVKVNLRVTLNGDDKKYVSFDDSLCNSEGLCVINNNSSYGSNSYSLVLNVNNAPNGYQIHPTFTFDVEENKYDTNIILGYNENSETNYYYSFENGTYFKEGLNNPMPTIVSSKVANNEYVIASDNSFTQTARYDGKDGRFITYLFGIKLDSSSISGLFYDQNEISFKVSFNQDGQADPIMNEDWIRLYGTEMIDGIRPITYDFPFSTSSIGDANKYIKKPGSITVTKEDNSYIVRLTNFELLLDRPSLNSNDSPTDGLYIATIALTNFSPRLDGDGQNVINNTMIVYNMNNQLITSRTIENNYEQVSILRGSNTRNVQTEADILTSSYWYDESEASKIAEDGLGAVSKGTVVKYITDFKNNRTSSHEGLKEIIKFDTNAYRVMTYDKNNEISIKVKCGRTECNNISKDDFEVKFVTGTFDNSNYELRDVNSLNLSSGDKNLANACTSLNISTLNNDQIQNLYGGPCIKAKDGVETVYSKISDSSKIQDDNEVEIPISKVIVQTKEGVTIPDGAEVIVSVKVRVRNVSDLTHTYQATTMILSSDYDENLTYYAPQIKNISDNLNNAISPNSYEKTTYAGQNYVAANGYSGDTLKIVNFTLRQQISVTNKNEDGTVKNRFKTSNNEIINYKVETSLVDNNINVGADDTWYIKSVSALVRIPNTLIYVPDDSLIQPTNVYQEGTDTVLQYLLITPSDKIKTGMTIKDIYFKTKLNPTLSGGSNDITVTSDAYGMNINDEIDTSIGRTVSYTITGTGINEVIGEQSIGESGIVIEKNGIINYILNAYNNTGENVNDYSIIDILPYNDDENGSSFSGSYSVKVSSSLGLSNIKCTSEVPSRITRNNNTIWEDCNVTSEFVENVTAIKMDNISISDASYMGEIIISLKTKDNNASDKYNNKFVGFTRTSNENTSNIVSVSVLNRSISGVAFLDNTGNSIRDENETFISEIPVSLYKINNEELNKVADTVTDENGYYVFNNLDVGRYKIRAKYDVNKYDLALRYATMDTSKDSDAYLIDNNGTIEISNKSETSAGLIINEQESNISNMDIGLQPKHTFGFIMNKYITKIELSNNGIITTNTYDNLSTVSLNVLNPNRYTTKVYYGISITNNSSRAGFVNLVKEDIPNGFIFDKNYPENAGWFEVDGMLGNRSLDNTVVYPNETVYLQIVLFLPARDEAGTFINTASIAEITEYNSINETLDAEYVNDDEYEVGDTLRYAGVNFHVIGVTPNGSEQILTLLADATQTSMNHGTSVYKWSNSNINGYLNNEWINTHNLDSSKLYDFNICDDASGLFNSNANGGVVNANSCASNIYTTSKVRLLTQTEFNTLINNLTDSSFLLNGDFWLMDAVYATTNSNTYNENGVLNTDYDTSNLVKYVKASNSTVLPVQGTNGFNKDVNANSNLQVRPVIRISSRSIIME